MAKVIFANIVNPDECWDWWGYSEGHATITGSFAERSGSQIRIINRMLTGLPWALSCVMPTD